MTTLRFERPAHRSIVKKPSTTGLGERFITITILPVVMLMIAFRLDLLEDRDKG